MKLCSTKAIKEIDGGWKCLIQTINQNMNDITWCPVPMPIIKLHVTRACQIGGGKHIKN